MFPGSHIKLLVTKDISAAKLTLILHEETEEASFFNGVHPMYLSLQRHILWTDD